MFGSRLRIPALNWSFFSGFFVATSAYMLLTLMTSSWSPGPPRRKRVLFFGDSITQHGWDTSIDGWVAAFAFHWYRRVDVLNRGYSGYNSRWYEFDSFSLQFTSSPRGLSLVDQMVISEQPDFITVFFGANDAVDERVLQHVPLSEYESNIRKIVSRIKAVSHIIL